MKLLVVLSAVAAVASGFNFCQPCCKLVGFIENEVTRDEPAEAHALDAACAELTHGNSIFTKICDVAVNEGLKIAVHFLDTNQPPSKVCHEAKLCDGSNDCTSSNPLLDQAGLPANVVSQICKLDAAAIKALNDGQVAKLCHTLSGLLHIPPGTCTKLLANKAQVETVLRLIQNYLCKNSLEPVEVEVEASNPFDDLCALDKMAIKLLDDGQAMALCKKYAPMINVPVQYCAYIGQYTPQLKIVLKMLQGEVCGKSLQGTLGDICALDKMALQALKDGQAVALCKRLAPMAHIPAQYCTYITQYESQLELLLTMVQSKVCGSSASEETNFLELLSSIKPCDAITFFINLLKDAEQLGGQVAQDIKEILPLLEMLKDKVCDSSVSHFSVAQHLNALGNQACQYIDEFQEVFDDYFPEVCNLLKEKDPKVDCDQIKGKVDGLVQLAKQLLRCSSSSAPLSLALSKGELCDVLAQAEGLCSMNSGLDCSGLLTPLRPQGCSTPDHNVVLAARDSDDGSGICDKLDKLDKFYTKMENRPCARWVPKKVCEAKRSVWELLDTGVAIEQLLQGCICLSC